MSNRKRVSYTLEFKLNVVKKAEEVGNREAGRLFDLDESNVRLWRKNKEKFSQSGRSRRSFRRGVESWPELENELYSWIVQERKKGAAMSTMSIRKKAKMMAVGKGIENFMAGPTWDYRFMRRKKLTIRNRTTGGQKLPEDWEQKRDSFLEFTRNLIQQNNFSQNEIFNMDEVPVSFDMPLNRTVDQIGANSVSINTTGHEKNSFTVVLACAANGDKLHPMIIFKRKTVPKENFPKDVVIQANQKGWMNYEIMIIWLNSVWRKRKNSMFKPRGLLIMDSMKAHTKDCVKGESKATGAKLSIIPGGLTKKLQPLDVGVNRSFKSKLRNLWEQWMMEGDHTLTPGGKMRRASYAEVAEWVKIAWNAVTVTTITNAFKKCEIIAGNPETDVGSDTDDNEAHNDCSLSENVLKMFHSDTDDSEFDGFSD